MHHAIDNTSVASKFHQPTVYKFVNNFDDVITSASLSDGVLTVKIVDEMIASSTVVILIRHIQIND